MLKGGKISGDKILKYHPMDKYYLLHIVFCYSYVSNCNKVRKVSRCLGTNEPTFPNTTVILEIITEA
jgi:hypothetical protein